MKNKINAAARGGEGCKPLCADLRDSPRGKHGAGEKNIGEVREVSEGAAGGWGARAVT